MAPALAGPVDLPFLAPPTSMTPTSAAERPSPRARRNAGTPRVTGHALAVPALLLVLALVGLSGLVDAIRSQTSGRASANNSATAEGMTASTVLDERKAISHGGALDVLAPIPASAQALAATPPTYTSSQAAADVTRANRPSSNRQAQ